MEHYNMIENTREFTNLILNKKRIHHFNEAIDAKMKPIIITIFKKYNIDANNAKVAGPYLKKISELAKQVYTDPNMFTDELSAALKKTQFADINAALAEINKNGANAAATTAANTSTPEEQAFAKELMTKWCQGTGSDGRPIIDVEKMRASKDLNVKQLANSYQQYWLGSILTKCQNTMAGTEKWSKQELNSVQQGLNSWITSDQTIMNIKNKIIGLLTNLYKTAK